jgi:hypothetical protein
MDNGKGLQEKINDYFMMGILPSHAKFGPGRSSGRKRRRIIWVCGLYVSVLFGILATYIKKELEGRNQGMMGDSLSTIIMALITSILIFPYVYRTAKFDTDKPNIMQAFMGFSYGFFWEKVMGQIKI